MTLLERDEMMRDEGREDGKIEVLANQICRKLRKGKSLDQIANELESTPEDIKNIVMIAESFAPDYPEEMVLEEVKNSLAIDSEMNMQS